MLKALILVLATTLLTPLAWSQDAKIDSLSPIDREFMQNQRDSIDELARRHFGERLRGEVEPDLRLLQRLLDQHLIARDDTQTLQAMGVILGNHLASHERLDWVIYIDRQGRSRALRIPGTNEVLFPMTMISRRYETGLEVDVAELYRRAQEIVAAVRHRNSPF